MYLIMTYDRDSMELTAEAYNLSNKEDVLTVHLKDRKDLIKRRSKGTNSQGTMPYNNTHINTADDVIKEYSKSNLYINIIKIVPYAKMATILFDNYTNEFLTFYNLDTKAALISALDNEMILNLGGRMAVLETLCNLKEVNNKVLNYSNIIETTVNNIDNLPDSSHYDDIIYDTGIPTEDEIAYNSDELYAYCRDLTYNTCLEFTKTNGVIELYKNINTKINTVNKKELLPALERTSVDFKRSILSIIRNNARNLS